jgi:hypothetical protein
LTTIEKITYGCVLWDECTWWKLPIFFFSILLPYLPLDCLDYV